MTIQDVLNASKLFESQTQIRNAMKNKAIKINGQVVDDLNEVIEHGDFLNFIWFCGGAKLVREHGAIFLAVSRGKDFASKTLLKLIDGELIIIA